MLCKNAFVVDVEEWFHLCDNEIEQKLGTPEKLEVRVVENTKKLIKLLKDNRCRASFFFVGWVAERYPDLLKEVVSEGFEIGCHSYSHRIIYEMSPEEFEQDLKRATEIITDIAGKRPTGYRAPGFSIKKDMGWYFDILAKNGYRYDASIFPTWRPHGGVISSPEKPYIVNTKYGDIYEVPQSVIGFNRLKICFSGGGYFRLLPYWFIKFAINRLNKNNIPVLIYIHPREIDINQPRIKTNKIKEFRYYINIEKTEIKLKMLLNDFIFTNLSEIIKEYFNMNDF